MANNRKRIRSGAAAAFAAAVLCGCSGWEPIEFHETSNIPEGPGLISGEKGGWTIFRVEEKSKQKPEQAPEQTGEANEQTALEQETD